MKLRNLVGPGLTVLGFAALSCFAPSCKAQEVEPDHFTLTGVETYPERTTSAAAAVKSSKNLQPAREAKQAKLMQPVIQERKTPASGANPAKLAPAAIRYRKTSPSMPKKSATPAPSN